MQMMMGNWWDSISGSIYVTTSHENHQDYLDTTEINSLIERTNRTVKGDTRPPARQRPSIGVLLQPFSVFD